MTEAIYFGLCLLMALDGPRHRLQGRRMWTFTWLGLAGMALGVVALAVR